MKKIATYTIILAALSSVACSRTDHSDIAPPQGDLLVVNAEIVSASEWKTRAQDSADAHQAQYGASTESDDGQLVLTATRQEWTSELDTAQSAVTRGTPITSAAGITKMRVNVFRTGASNWTTASARTSAIEATRSGNSYTTSPAYNWPMDPAIKTSLFAYAPLTSGTNGLSENGTNKINYTVPTVVANQPDLCVAVPKIDVINADGTQQTQSFALNHQLTAVGFSMLGWNLRIDEITISDIAVTGILTMNTNGTTSWTTSTTDSRSVGVTKGSFTHDHNDSYADITTSNGHLMMIPQTFSDAAKITIKYTGTNGAVSGATTAMLKDLGVPWVAGDKITYQIRLKTAPAVTSGELKINTYLAGYTTSSPMTISGEGKDRLTFTWSATWLKIHLGLALNGNIGLGTGAVSGWSTDVSAVTSARSLYFFATDNNTSTTLERTAEITVSGTRSGTKKFTVRQVKTPPTEIEINGIVWALSNAGSANWHNAPALCKSPWRLPSRPDFQNLRDSGRINETGLQSGYFWSSTIGINMRAWYLLDGALGTDLRTSTYAVRCVKNK